MLITRSFDVMCMIMWIHHCVDMSYFLSTDRSPRVRVWVYMGAVSMSMCYVEYDRLFFSKVVREANFLEYDG